MPFAGYKNFDACVAANRNKKNPKAYCADIMRKVEEGMPRDLFDRLVIDVQEAEFKKDEETGKMTGRVQLIKAGRAKGKKREYTANALQKAAKEGVYNGMRMFVDHSDKPPTSRKTLEMVSAVESTEWDPRAQAIVGNVEFFDEKFFGYAQNARKYMGVSADHQIGVTYVQEGQERIQRVISIPFARSVDWVIYPAAGGEILSFAREAEGEDEVEWSEVTPEMLQEHAPEVFKAIQAAAKPAKESTEPDPKDDDEDEEKPLTRADITKIVTESMTGFISGQQEKINKISTADKATKKLIDESGLAEPVRKRLARELTGKEVHDEAAVQEAINEAKLELKALGLGPRITGMGPSRGSGGSSAQEDEEEHEITVRESVESHFIKPKATKTASGKES